VVARTWRGTVTAEKSGDYLMLLRTVGLGDYQKTQGNLGAFALQRRNGDVMEFMLVSFWQSLESIKAYAGDDIEVPQYATFDPDYLIDLKPSIQHHAVFGGQLRAAAGECAIARTWHGAVPIGKSDDYLSLMRSVALNDYRRTPGNHAAFVLHRVDGELAHFITLTFWASREAIKAFAGDDIDAAKYYDFDRDFLVELEPTVLHYEVFGNPNR
jgi:heme-degrading monooxygenase HmoA